MGILEEAEKLVREPDAIINLMDFSLEFVSKKISDVTGMNREDLIGKCVYEILAHNKEEVRQMGFNDLREMDGERDIKFATKSKKPRNSRIKFRILQKGNNYYLIGKIMKLEKLE